MSNKESKKSHLILAVVLPMYNEEKNIEPLLSAINKSLLPSDVNLLMIAVNDGSQDNTLAVLKKQEKIYDNLVVVDHVVNKGLAAALKTGINESIERKVDLLAFMDSDLTHNPDDLSKFVDKIREGYDFVVGSRFIKGGGMKDIPLKRVLFSKLGNTAAKILFRLPVLDYTTGFRVVKREVFESIEIEEKGFGIQMEEVVKAYAKGFRIGEVPIILGNRKFGKSSMRYDYKLVKNYLSLFSKCLRWLQTRKNGQN